MTATETVATATATVTTTTADPPIQPSVTVNELTAAVASITGDSGREEPNAFDEPAQPDSPPIGTEARGGPPRKTKKGR